MTTIIDVAKVAGVSVSTVSRILNNKSDVAESTRHHVLAVIDQLGYHPHAQARRLRADARKSQTISLLYPLQDTPFASVINSSVLVDYIQGISYGVEESGYHLNLMTSNITTDKLLKTYRSSQIDGAIIMQVAIHDKRIQALQETDYPFIMIGRTGDNQGIRYVDFDYRQGVIEAFDYLQSLGHTQIGFLTYPQVLIEQEYGPAHFAMRGYQDSLDKLDMPAPYVYCDIEMQSIINATENLLSQHPDLTGLVVVHGEYLNGVIAGAKRCNRTIPEEMSVVVISNKNQAEMVTPQMTRVDLPAADSGYRAALLLIQQIENRDTSVTQIICDTRIYEGGSTGPVDSA